MLSGSDIQTLTHPELSEPANPQPSPFTVFLAVSFTLLAVLIPVALARYPALVDFPNHLARHYIGATIDSSPDLQKYYAYSWRPVANMAGDVVFLGLNNLFSPLTSERIIIGLAISLWVIAPFFLNRAIWGDWSIGSCLGGLVVFNNALRGGLENFLLSSASSVFVFALWIYWCRNLTLVRVVVFSAFATMIYLGHILGFVVLGLLIGPHELQRALTSSGHRFSRLGRLVSSAAIFVPAVFLYFFFDLTTRNVGDFVSSYGGFESRLYSILSLVLMYYPAIDVLTLIFFLGVIGWRFCFVKERALHHSLVFPIIVLFVASLSAPAILQDIRGVHVRLPAILAAILVAAIDWRPVRLKQWRVIGIIFVSVLALRSGSIAMFWKQHEQEITELRSLFSDLPRGAVVLPIVNEHADTGEFHWFSLSYAVLDRQIFTPSLYPDIHMLSIRPAYAGLTQLVATPVQMSDLPMPSVLRLNAQAGMRPYWATWWNDFSHVLLLSTRQVDPPFPEFLQLIGERSVFRLYRVRRNGSPLSR